jgi:hypothetical protein
MRINERGFPSLYYYSNLDRWGGVGGGERLHRTAPDGLLYSCANSKS